MKLDKLTVVTNPDTGREVALFPGREVPAWAVAVIEQRERAERYEQMTVAELQEEIRARNEGRNDDEHLSTEGRKAELIERLSAADRS